MDWIAIDGIKSNAIPDLIIQELPGYTIPGQRIVETELDGKSGSRIEILGYSTYERRFKIGLKTRNHLDDLIKWLHLSGEIVFSDRPDLVQKYDLVNQIDVTRLLRFGEAEIVIKCQPFKYLVEETPLSPSVNALSVEDVTVPSGNGNLFQLTDFDVLAGGFAVDVLESFTGGRFYAQKVVNNLNPESEYYVSGNCTSGFDRVFVYSDELWGTQITSGLIGSGLSFIPGVQSVVLGFYCSSRNAGEQGVLDSLWFNTSPVTEFIPANTINIVNAGNVFSQPTIQGIFSGYTQILCNNSNSLIVDVGEQSVFVSVDCESGNGFYADGTLANRVISGNPLKNTLSPGNNKISWSGAISNFTILKKDRWI